MVHTGPLWSYFTPIKNIQRSPEPYNQTNCSAAHPLSPCYRLNSIPSKSICWSSKLRMWSYWGIKSSHIEWRWSHTGVIQYYLPVSFKKAKQWTETLTEGKCPVKVRVMLPQAEKWPAAGREWKLGMGPSPGPSEGAWPYQHLVLRLPASKTVRLLSVGLIQSGFSTWLWQR